MIFFKLVLTSLALAMDIAGQNAINSTSLSCCQDSNPTAIIRVPSFGGTMGTGSNTTTIPSSSISSAVLKGNISFTNHSASGYTHPISLFSSYRALSTPTSSNTQANFTTVTVPESRGYNLSGTRSSRLGILVATSSSAVLVVTETNSAGTFTAWLPITTTITSPPPAYSTCLVLNTLWHSETTTTSGATTFPVLYSCGALCGGDDHGLIIKGLGGDPTDPIRTGCSRGLIGSIFRSPFSCGTEFNFPPLVPFAIGVDGIPKEVRDLDLQSTNLLSTASIPSTTSMTSTSMTSTKMTSTNITSTGASTSTSMTSTKITSTGPSSSSLTSDCGTKIAFLCSNSSTCTTWARASCLATSTCSSIATGCNLTSSSSLTTPSSLPSKYLIYPIDGLSQNQTSGLASLLESELGLASVTQIPLDENESIFIALMNSSMVNDLKKKQPMISSIDLDYGVKLSDDNVTSTQVTARHMRSNSTSDISLTKRSELIYQHLAPLELAFVSQPEGAELSQLHDYVFDRSVDIGGSQSYFSQGGDFLNISAPGSFDKISGIQCASNDSVSWKRVSGTSLAAPAVAGLAAYFLSIKPELQEPGMVPKKVLGYIKSLAWTRNNGPIAIWNNESIFPPPPPECSMNITGARRNKRVTLNATACSISWFGSSSTTKSGVLSASGPVFGTESLPMLGLSSALSKISPSTSSVASASGTSTQPHSTMSEPAYFFICDNTSLEDRDGICTCSGAVIGTSTTTFTPPGGPGNVCPTPPPSKVLYSTSSRPSLTSSTKPPPSYAAGQCNVHVWQGLGQEIGQANIYLNVNITDAKGASVGYGNGSVSWAATLSIYSKLADIMKVTPQTRSQSIKRGVYSFLWKKLVPPSSPRPLYENGPINVCPCVARRTL